MKTLRPSYIAGRKNDGLLLDIEYAVFTNMDNSDGPATILLQDMLSDQVQIAVFLESTCVSFLNLSNSGILWSTKSTDGKTPRFEPMSKTKLYYIKTGHEGDILIPCATNIGQWVLADLHFVSQNKDRCLFTLHLP